jgi:uncharacterized protein YbjT (DUF2867 family)
MSHDENAKPSLTILVVGATGSIGGPVIAEALREGHRVRALVRRPSEFKASPGVEVFEGDLARPETLPGAVDGVDAVVFTHGVAYGDQAGAEAVDYGGVRNILQARDGRTIRIALMTAIGVTDRKGSHDWKRRAERLVRASGLPYTIVRPGWFDYNRPDQLRLALLQGDTRQTGTPKDGVVARRQIAQVLVRSLSSGYALRKTFELVAETGAEEQDFDRLFASAEADEHAVLDAVRDNPNMPQCREPPRVISDLERLRAG